MTRPKTFTLVLTYNQAVTLHFAIVAYAQILRAEIEKPTRPHGPSESAAALTGVKDLARAFETQVAL